MNSRIFQSRRQSPPRPMTTTRRTVVLTLPAIALLILAGCHYSLLTPSRSLAAWSPDGSRLAVCIDNEAGDSGELWLVEPESGRMTKLLDGQRSPGLPHLLAPRWSPDGKTLYCARTTAGEKDERRPAAIIGIDLISGTESDVGVIHYTGGSVDHFGSTQAFIPLADGTLAAQNLGEDSVYRLVRIDPASGTRSSFASPAGSWMVISGSADGQQLAVAVPGKAGSGARISVFNSRGEQRPHPLDLWAASENSAEAQLSLTWSPTAARLAIMVEDLPPAGSKWSIPAPVRDIEEKEDDFATLLLLEPESGGAVPIAHDVFGTPPVFSPDGKHLAYAASSGIRDGDGDLLLEVRVLTELAEDTEVSLPGLALPLAWSTDSSKLAYYLGQPDDDNKGTVISVAPDGSGTRVVSRHQQDRLAVPSPTGGRLAWVSGSGAVQVIDPGTGRVLFHAGLTTAGTLQAGEDHLLQERPEAALETWSALDSTPLSSGQSARLAAGSYAALHTLDRPGDAARLLDRACSDLQQREDPATAFLILCGALSDFGFRPEAERVVEQQIIARYPDSPEAMEALWALAALKQDEGDAEAALRYLERLLRSYPEERKEVVRALLLAALAETGENQAVVIELAGMIIEANGDQEDSDQAAPRAVAHYARATALEQNGNSEQAREAYAAALAQRTKTNLSDGRSVADLCWEALLRLARNETPAARR